MSADKTMLPEVLPDPEACAHEARLSPRDRTIRHMKRLMKLGVAAGTAMQLSYCFPDPLPDDDDMYLDDDDSAADDDDSASN